MRFRNTFCYKAMESLQIGYFFINCSMCIFSLFKMRNLNRFQQQVPQGS